MLEKSTVCSLVGFDDSADSRILRKEPLRKEVTDGDNAHTTKRTRSGIALLIRFILDNRCCLEDGH